MNCQNCEIRELCRHAHMGKDARVCIFEDNTDRMQLQTVMEAADARA